LGGGMVYAGLVSLTSSYPSLYSPYFSELFVLGGGLVCLQGLAVCVCVRACVQARALRAFGCVWERTSV